MASIGTGVGRMSGATVSLSDRLIGAAPVALCHDRADKELASFAMVATNSTPLARCVSVPPFSEYSSTNGWNQNYNTSNPGNQNNNNNKTNTNRARAVRRPEAPCCNVTTEELFQAYYDCRRHKRNTNNALIFECNLERNLMKLYDELQNNTYYPGYTQCFVVSFPKPREVWAADFRDRIVHHVLYNRIANKFYRSFTVDTCACIPGRGTLYAVERLEKHLRSATQNWTQPRWVLQMDLANFFVSIDKKVLDEILTKRIDDTYTLYLARLLLHHDPTENVLIRSSQNLMETIPRHKSLFHSNGKGLPVGNLTSQFFANVYLDPLDQYIKRILKQRYYVRYVDDIIIVGNPDQDASDLYNLSLELNQFVKNTLGTSFHPRKTCIQRADQGVDFVGFIVRPYARYLRRRTLSSAYYKLKVPPSKKDLAKSLNSYFGLLQNSSGWKQRQRLATTINKYGFQVNSLLTKVTNSNMVLT